MTNMEIGFIVLCVLVFIASLIRTMLVEVKRQHETDINSFKEWTKWVSKLMEIYKSHNVKPKRRDPKWLKHQFNLCKSAEDVFYEDYPELKEGYISWVDWSDNLIKLGKQYKEALLVNDWKKYWEIDLSVEDAFKKEFPHHFKESS